MIDFFYVCYVDMFGFKGICVDCLEDIDVVWVEVFVVDCLVLLEVVIDLNVLLLLLYISFE